MGIFIIGDIHLKDNKDGIYWDYNHKGLLDFIKSLKISSSDYVFLLGDVFDKAYHKGYTNLAALSVGLELNKSAKTYVIAGNHDGSIYSGTNLEIFKVFDNISVINDITCVECMSLKFVLLPFVEGLPVGGKYEAKVNELSIKSCDYILGHHFFKQNTFMESPYLKLDSLNFKYGCCIMGHNHKFQKISNKLICIGSVTPCNKGERDYTFKYITIEKDLECKDIPSNFFIQFIKVPYSEIDKINLNNNKDFYIVDCLCKKEEKYTIDGVIRKKLGKNLYDIEWSYSDDNIVEQIEIRSENDLELNFFKEKDYSKSVKDLALEFLSKEVL